MLDAVEPDVEWVHAGHGHLPTGRRRVPPQVRIIASIAVLIATLVAVPALLRSGSQPQSGSQAIAPPPSVGAASGRSWVVMVPLDGSSRDGWPRPMISRDEGFCFGFENDVFGEPPRPSLARCVDPSTLPPLDSHQIVSLMTIEAGVDVWHVIVVPRPLSKLALTSGDRADIAALVAADRIHIDGEVAVLRLERSSNIYAIEWRSGRTGVRCVPSEDAVLTGLLCPPSRAPSR